MLRVGCIELPHADLAAKALVSTEGNACTDGINLELSLDGVVVSKPVTPRLNATSHDGQQHYK